MPHSNTPQQGNATTAAAVELAFHRTKKTLKFSSLAKEAIYRRLAELQAQKEGDR